MAAGFLTLIQAVQDPDFACSPTQAQIIIPTAARNLSAVSSSGLYFPWARSSKNALASAAGSFAIYAAGIDELAGIGTEPIAFVSSVCRDVAPVAITPTCV